MRLQPNEGTDCRPDGCAPILPVVSYTVGEPMCICTGPSVFDGDPPTDT